MTSPRLALPALAAALALLATGCEAVIDGQSAAQPDGVGGDLELTTTFCAGNGDATVANDSTACGSDYSVSGKQFLIAYAVPAGTDPEAASASGPFGDAALTRDPSLETWLDAHDPAGAGRAWVGYRTERLTAAAPTDGKAAGSAVVRFDAPDAVTAELPVRTVALMRAVADDAAAAQPVDCTTGCSPIETLSGVTLPTALARRDADLAAPAGDVQTAPGATATVPFTLDYRGADASGPLTPKASTTLPDATAAAPESVQAASTGQTPFDVTVPVPAGAAAGTYDVKVELPLADGQVRTATRRLVVVAPKAAEPAPAAPAAPATPVAPAPAQPAPAKPAPLTAKQLTAAIAKGAAVRAASPKQVAAKGLQVTQTFPAAGAAVFELRLSAGGRERALSRPLRTAVPATGKVAVRVRLAAKGKKLLAGRKAARAVLVVRFRDASGTRVSVRVPVKLG